MRVSLQWLWSKTSICRLGPLLLTLVNFNHSMNTCMWFYSLFYSLLQRLYRWSSGMDKLFQPTFYNLCNYLSMLWLKSICVGKRARDRVTYLSFPRPVPTVSTTTMCDHCGTCCMWGESSVVSACPGFVKPLYPAQFSPFGLELITLIRPALIRHTRCAHARKSATSAPNRSEKCNFDRIAQDFF